MPIDKRFYRFALIISLAGASMSPFISHANFAQELQKIHDESEQQREERKEQFRQDVLEKRKEVLTKWQDRKEEFKVKLKEGQDRIKFDFELRRTKEEETRASATVATSTPVQENESGNGFFSVIKQKAQDFVHAFSLKRLFGK
ncbi:MAG: hypothetical protein U1A23_04660 [Candidatus Sungbacteria bacterium]|nr:hypothetical protein [bacterium]MDZ4286197.1 hypothetical protein [Candidatus Sungbacteria bacterium]